MKKLILLFVCIIISGCSNYSELNKLSIVTAVGIDKNDGYEVSVLIANSPKAQTSSKEGEAKTTVYKAKGSSIGDAVKTINKKCPKQLYFSHVNAVIISDEIGKDGFLKVADWLMRNPETRNRFYLMQVNGQKASDVLKIISPLESYPSQSIATLIESSQNARSIGDSASYSNFIGRILEEGYEPIMPTIKINGSVSKGSKQENLETAEPSTYLSLGNIAIYRKDKYIGTVSKKESEYIQILNSEIKELVYPIKYKSSKINIYSNDINTKIKLSDDSIIDIYVKGRGKIYEINGKACLNCLKDINNLNKIWNRSLKRNLSELIKKIQTEYKSDIFGFGNLIYKNYPNKWKSLKNNWSNDLKNIKVNIHTNVEIIDAGSLYETIKEE